MLPVDRPAAKGGPYVLDKYLVTAGRMRAFIERKKIKVLNVAGPRASTEPQIGEFVRRTLDTTFARTSL